MTTLTELKDYIDSLPTYWVFTEEVNGPIWQGKAADPGEAVSLAAEEAYDDWGWEDNWDKTSPIFTVHEVGKEDIVLSYVVVLDWIPTFYPVRAENNA